ncbi:hypothetical protein [Ilumatobacter sp.]|uniref:hypothetical protein n=1 Tax=Ilumatobacter sp. TaxID=1967498 RepID=UPI003B52EDE0
MTTTHLRTTHPVETRIRQPDVLRRPHHRPDLAPGPAAGARADGRAEAPSGVGVRHRSALLDELDREWERLRRRPRTAREVRSWFEHDPDLAARCVPSGARVTPAHPLESLVAATQRGRRRDDEILAHLLHLAHDAPLAGRVVLQRILPGLISQARRWQSLDDDPVDLAVGAAWMAIRRFDPDARPRSIAPALIADAAWIAFRRPTRRKQHGEVPVEEGALVARPVPDAEADPMVALAGTIRAASRAGVESTHLDVIRRLAVAGSPTVAARREQVSTRTIRNRRDAACERIRRALGPDWTDWSDPVVGAA